MQSTPQRDIEELLEGCIRKDRRAQQMLFKKFFTEYYYIAYRYLGDEDEAKDCVQESFIKIFDNISNYNKSGSFGGWMRRIVVNTSIDFFRKKKNSFISTDEIQIAQDEEDDSDLNPNAKIYNTLIEEVGMEAVLNEINSLTPIYRAVMNMFFVENLKHREIAELLNINEGTSKSNLFKAKNQLKKRLIALQKKTNV